jgi:LysM repeat protein
LGGASAETVHVRPGQTLQEIARRHGVGVGELIRLNRSRYRDISLDYVQAGWRLKLPGSSGEGRSVRVRRGETLSRIADRNGVSIDVLIRTNRDRYPEIRSDYVQVGWELIVPGKGGKSSSGWRPIRSRPAGGAGPLILFRAGANRSVREEMARTVEQAAIRSGVRSIEISSTTNARHREGSPHYAGLGIDICEINGTPIRNLGARSGPVRKLQLAFEQDPAVQENYGPLLVYLDHRPYRPRNYWGIWRQHLNHIHVTR